MKKQRTPQSIAAQRASTGRGIFVLVVGLAAGVFAAGVAGDFILFHCVLAAAVAVSGGMTVARVTLPIDPASAASAGSRGGLLASIGYALPFLALSGYNYVMVNESTAGQMLAALTPAQVAQAEQYFIAPGASPVDYFKAQYLSYFFGYLLAALFFGWLFGLVGGAFMRRRHGA